MAEFLTDGPGSVRATEPDHTVRAPSSTGPTAYLFRWAKRAFTTLRHLPDVLLHPVRHRLALARVRRRGVPRSILLVCFGNICRSPYAAFALGRALPEDLRHRVAILSGGLFGAGRESPDGALAAAARFGVDLSRHRSTRLSADLVRQADLVVVMDPKHRRTVCRDYGRTPADTVVLGDLDPTWIVTRAVLDPYGQSEAVFDACFRRIDVCTGLLADVISRAAQAAGPPAPA